MVGLSLYLSVCVCMHSYASAAQVNECMNLHCISICSQVQLFRYLSINNVLVYELTRIVVSVCHTKHISLSLSKVKAYFKDTCISYLCQTESREGNCSVQNWVIVYRIVTSLR